MSVKSQAISALEMAYNELQQAAAGIPDDRMTDVWFGEWSAKDLLAHMASWDEVVSEDLLRIGRGHVPVFAAFREADVDEWNAFLMRPRKLFSLAQVRHESRQWHDRAAASMEALPDGLFAPGNMVAAFAAIDTGHYLDHARAIREWRQREGI